ELKDELLALGHSFSSETDTEVASNLIAHYYADPALDGDLPEAVMRAVRRLKGSFSLCIMAHDLPRMMIGVRQNMPLLVGHGPDATYLGSDVTAFLAYTREVSYLSDGEM